MVISISSEFISLSPQESGSTRTDEHRKLEVYTIAVLRKNTTRISIAKIVLSSDNIPRRQRRSKFIDA